MLTMLLTALYRYSMLEKLARSSRGQWAIALIKAFYDRQPRKVQLAIAGAALALLAWVLVS